MKVDGPSFEVLNVPTASPDVISGIVVLSITEGSIRGADSKPPTSSSLPAGGPMSEPPTERKRGDGDDKKKKAIVVKVVRKAYLGGSSNSDGDDLGAYPFSNLDII